jgi:hypothetical protein
MMTVLDYKGFRLIAMSRLPIKGNDTLVYGSRDAGKTILLDKKFNAKLKIVCENLGLKSHKIIPMSLRHSNDAITQAVTLHTPVDLEGHKGHDGRYYLLDFSRIFPPEFPDRSIKGSYLFRLLRPGNLDVLLKLTVLKRVCENVCEIVWRIKSRCLFCIFSWN